jgi:hypothetical protein
MDDETAAELEERILLLAPTKRDAAAAVAVFGVVGIPAWFKSLGGRVTLFSMYSCTIPTSTNVRARPSVQEAEGFTPPSVTQV